MEYQHYSVDDFLTDQHFQKWVLNPDEEDQSFWENWVLTHPQQKPVVEQAKRVLLSIQLKDEPSFGEAEAQQLWRRIQDTKASR